jgi:hypothetical protein
MERAIQEMLHSGVAASTVAGTDYLSNNDDGVNIGSNEDADESAVIMKQNHYFAKKNKNFDSFLRNNDQESISVSQSFNVTNLDPRKVLRGSSSGAKDSPSMMQSIEMIRNGSFHDKASPGNSILVRCQSPISPIYTEKPKASHLK